MNELTRTQMTLDPSLLPEWSPPRQGARRMPSFLVDGLRRIRWASPPFARLVGMTEASLVGSTFGEAIGCINAIVERAPCGQTSRCGFCLLEQALDRGLGDRESIGPVHLVRTVTIRGAPVERSFEFVVRPVRAYGECMVYVELPTAGTS
jgi:hypothetical protein